MDDDVDVEVIDEVVVVEVVEDVVAVVVVVVEAVVVGGLSLSHMLSAFSSRQHPVPTSRYGRLHTGAGEDRQPQKSITAKDTAKSLISSHLNHMRESI